MSPAEAGELQLEEEECLREDTVWVGSIKNTQHLQRALRKSVCLKLFCDHTAMSYVRKLSSAYHCI